MPQKNTVEETENNLPLRRSKRLIKNSCTSTNVLTGKTSASLATSETKSMQISCEEESLTLKSNVDDVKNVNEHLKSSMKTGIIEEDVIENETIRDETGKNQNSDVKNKEINVEVVTKRITRSQANSKNKINSKQDDTATPPPEEDSEPMTGNENSEVCDEIANESCENIHTLEKLKLVDTVQSDDCQKEENINTCAKSSENNTIGNGENEASDQIRTENDKMENSNTTLNESEKLDDSWSEQDAVETSELSNKYSNLEEFETDTLLNEKKNIEEMLKDRKNIEDEILESTDSSNCLLIAEEEDAENEDKIGKNEKEEKEEQSNLCDENDIDSKINDLLMQTVSTSDGESTHEPNEFLDLMAEEGEEDTPSEGSNDIVEVGEEINTTESEFSADESYENDSFIDDEEQHQLLSGEEYDLSFEEQSKKKSRIICLSSSGSDDEIVKIARPKKEQPKKRKKSRIIKMSDSSDEEGDRIDAITEAKVENKKNEISDSKVSEDICNDGDSNVKELINENVDVIKTTRSNEEDLKNNVEHREGEERVIDVKNTSEDVIDTNIQQIEEEMDTTFEHPEDEEEIIDVENLNEDVIETDKQHSENTEVEERIVNVENESEDVDTDIRHNEEDMDNTIEHINDKRKVTDIKETSDVKHNEDSIVEHREDEEITYVENTSEDVETKIQQDEVNVSNKESEEFLISSAVVNVNVKQNNNKNVVVCESIKVQDIHNTELSSHIKKMIDLLYSRMKNVNEVILNLSLDYVDYSSQTGEPKSKLNERFIVKHHEIKADGKDEIQKEKKVQDETVQKKIRKRKAATDAEQKQEVFVIENEKTKKNKKRDKKRKRPSKKIFETDIIEEETIELNIKTKKRKRHSESDNKKQINYGTIISPKGSSKAFQETQKRPEAFSPVGKKRKIVPDKTSGGFESTSINILGEALLNIRNKKTPLVEVDLPLDRDWQVKNRTVRPLYDKKVQQGKRMDQEMKCTKSENEDITKKFSKKDFKNFMLYDSSRVKRISIKKVINKKAW